jgi:hypothetical protein
MTAPENSLSRWSRMKREAVSKSRVGADLDDAATASVRPANMLPEAGLDEGLADPQDLPSIDTITFDTDIRAFLKSRVPADLTRAALRRAWTSDPAIRDFIGIAENQWDFNNPTAIPGFGPLQANDDISALLAQAFGQPSELVSAIAEVPIAVERAASVEIAGEIGAPEQPDIPGVSNAAAAERAEIAPDAEQDTGTPPKRRAHGGALPR